MPYLVDTNIALRLANASDREHLLVVHSVRTLTAAGETLFYTQQSRREFWNVCTRPLSANGRGMTIAETIVSLLAAAKFLSYLPDSAATGPVWDRLVRQYNVIGRAVHDAQLVASMLANGITHILTLNGVDFQRYSGEIIVVHPRDV
jgi:predicted nucleic acid-binding protein